MKLHYTRPALADLGVLLDAIATQSPQGARRIQAVIGLLPLHPHIGTLTDAPGIRRITTPPYSYLGFYEVAQAEIIIHAVRHGARDPSGMPGPA